jgi:S-adenosylmethionine hydrolase
MSPIVTLTTDFGSGSGYVAELKGRLLHARAPLTLVDIAHDVAAHDLQATAWLVARACPAFPSGTLHLVVVDPGVGTSRRIVWVRAGEHHYLAPDNGVLSRVLGTTPVTAAHALQGSPTASPTFHGRDIIAPAAVSLIEGADPASLGPAIHDLTVLDWSRPRRTADGVLGEVVHVDTFGNLLTNLPADLLPALRAVGRLRVGRHVVTTVVDTYGDAPAGTPVALVGSQGVIEAAVVEGRASDALAAKVGTPVSLPLPDEPGRGADA